MDTDTIGIISIIVGVIIAIVPFLWRLYFSRPELTIEIVFERGMSSNEGLSCRNNTLKGYIDSNSAIYVFKATWEYKIIIRNNSANTAYYPKIFLDTERSHFTIIDKLNELRPILATEPIELKAKYEKFEECQGVKRIEAKDFPNDLKSMRILLEYKNSAKTKRFTLYNHDEVKKNIFLYRMPKFFTAK